MKISKKQNSKTKNSKEQQIESKFESKKDLLKQSFKEINNIFKNQLSN